MDDNDTKIQQIPIMMVQGRHSMIEACANADHQGRVFSHTKKIMNSTLPAYKKPLKG